MRNHDGRKNKDSQKLLTENSTKKNTIFTDSLSSELKR